MRSFFRHNPKLAEELEGQDETKQALAEQAKSAQANSEQLAVRIMPSQSQAFEVVEDDDGVRLVNTDHGGHLAEFGSSNNPPLAPLRRGVRAAGFRLEEE